MEASGSHEAAAMGGQPQTGTSGDALVTALLSPEIWACVLPALNTFDVLQLRLVSKRFRPVGEAIRLLFAHVYCHGWPTSAAALQKVVAAFPNAKRLKLCLGSGGKVSMDKHMAASTIQLITSLTGALTSDGAKEITLLKALLRSRQALYPKGDEEDTVPALRDLLSNISQVLPHHFALSAGPVCARGVCTWILMALEGVRWLKSLALLDLPYIIPMDALCELGQLEEVFIRCHCPNGQKYGRFDRVLEAIVGGPRALKRLTLSGYQMYADLTDYGLEQVAKLTNLVELRINCYQGSLHPAALNSLSSLQHLTRLCIMTPLKVYNSDGEQTEEEEHSWDAASDDSSDNSEASSTEDTEGSEEEQGSDGETGAAQKVPAAAAAAEQAAAAAVAANPPSATSPPQLRRLMFSVGCMSGALATWLVSCHSLQVLTLRFSNGQEHMPAEGWAQLHSRLPARLQLNVQLHGDNELLADLMDASSLCEVPVVGLGQLSNMHSLELKSCKVCTGDLLSLLGRLPKLQQLVLRDVRLEAWDADETQWQQQLQQKQQRIQQQQEQKEQQQQQQQQQGYSAAGGASSTNINAADAERTASYTLLGAIATKLPQLRVLRCEQEDKRSLRCFLAVDDDALRRLATGCPHLEVVTYNDGKRRRRALSDEAGAGVSEAGFRAFVAQVGPAQLQRAVVEGYQHHRLGTCTARQGPEMPSFGVLYDLEEKDHLAGRWPDDANLEGHVGL